MKKIHPSSCWLNRFFSLGIAWLLLIPATHAQLASWDLTGVSQTATANATSSNPNLASVPVLVRGPGAPASTGSNSFRTQGFQNNGISVSNTDYFEVSIQAAEGFTLSLSTIDAYCAGTSSFSASPGTTNQFAYSLDGVNFTLIGSPLVRIGSGALPQVSLSGIPNLQNIPSGTVVTLRYYASGQTATGGWGFNSPNSSTAGLSIGGSINSSAAGAPLITSPSSASATAFEPFSYQIEASNSPTNYNATALPDGLTVNSTTGLISGTPTTPGNQTVTISASNAEGTASAQLLLFIAKNPGAPLITGNLTASGLAGSPFNYQITADNSPTSYSSGTLPNGLQLDAETGLISGTPDSGGNFNIPITASNSLGSDTQTLAITLEGVPSITSVLSGSTYTGSAFSYQITASAIPAATSYEAAGLPEGLTINSTTGVISGTPTTAGTSNITLTATNSVGNGNATFVLAVFDQAAQNAIPLDVVVNKYVNATTDRVQLLVVGNGTVGSTVDLRGRILKDFSGSNANDGGGRFLFTDNLLWSAVPAGTLIALSVGTTLAEDLDPSDFLLEVNLGNETFFTNGGGSFDIASTDMLLIKSAGSGYLGVAGGIHALIGGSAGTQGTSFTGAKLRSTGTSGTNLGVMALNSNSQLQDYGTSGQAESTDAQGGVAAASLDFAGSNTPANQNFINSLRGVVDGTGSAAILNATPGSPFVAKNLFARNLANQTVSIVFTPVSPSTPVSAIAIEIPAGFGAPSAGKVSLESSASQNASISVIGQNVTIADLSLTNPETVTVSISGLATPDTALSISNNGSYSFPVRSQGVGGTLTPLAASPVARVLIPIANVRNADPTTFVPFLANQTVAVEGVCSVGRLGTGNTNSALQDATHGVTIFSQSAVTGPQNRGNRYAAVGTVAQFNGLVQLNLTDPSLLIDLGPEGDPTPVTISAAEFNANGLAYQSRVIRIEGLSFVSGNWTTGQNVILQDSANTQVTVRIQSGSTAGQPSFPVDLTGLGGQFDNSSPFDTGFQIQPRDQADAPVLPPVLTSPTTANATQGEFFSYQITTTNNPPATSFSADPLPSGLALDTATGLLSGTPAQSGNFNILISATNAGGATVESLILTVGSASAYDSWASGFGLDPAITSGSTAGAPSADPDSDAFTNLQEFAFGTNPTVPNGALVRTSVADGNLTVTWNGPAAGLDYAVQKTDNLSTTAFADDSGIPIDSADGTMSFTVPLTGTKMFYRVLASPAP